MDIQVAGNMVNMHELKPHNLDGGVLHLELLVWFMLQVTTLAI